ncbi:MAG: hypothetical protein AB7M05_05845 [Alphaproteobacteria bacterium]
MMPAVIFFFVGFNMVLLTKQLFLDAYLITLADLMLAAVSALIAGKVVLVGDAIPLMRRYENAPLIYSILYKTAFYVVLVFFARLIEAGIPFIGHGGFDAFLDHMLNIFSWQHFIATQLWIIVLFAVYVTGAELARLFGDGELYKIFFKRRSSHLKLTRRQRFREMVRLHHLTDRHTVEEFRDPDTPAHREMIAIIRRLARDKPITRS